MKKVILFTILISSLVITGCIKKTSPVLENVDEQTAGDGQQTTEQEQEQQINVETEIKESAKIVEGTEGWQVYEKEDMGIRLKYHKDWYYDRDESAEKELGYDLYIGFAESAEILKKGRPYPIEFFILPSDVKFSYARCLKTMAQRDNKKYVLRSDSFVDRKIAAKMAENFEFINREETSETKHVCVDSDNGKDYFKKGKVEINSNFMTDFCSKDKLFEFYCLDNTWNMENYICPNGCGDGACLN